MGRRTWSKATRPLALSPQNRPAVLPACHRNVKLDRQKKREREREKTKIVDAIAPRREPIFTAIKRVRANVRHIRLCAEGKVEKISLPDAYVVTRDEHRGKQEDEGGNDLVT